MGTLTSSATTPPPAQGTGLDVRSETDIVTLSLISHTNAGKTTLARTLLRSDIGEVRDAPHVTLFNESYTLLNDPGSVLRLWDTPGFWYSPPLFKRRTSPRNPVLVFLSQNWGTNPEQ